MFIGNDPVVRRGGVVDRCGPCAGWRQRPVPAGAHLSETEPPNARPDVLRAVCRGRPAALVGLCANVPDGCRASQRVPDRSSAARATSRTHPAAAAAVVAIACRVGVPDASVEPAEDVPVPVADVCTVAVVPGAPSGLNADARDRADEFEETPLSKPPPTRRSRASRLDCAITPVGWALVISWPDGVADRISTRVHLGRPSFCPDRVRHDVASACRSRRWRIRPTRR